MTNTTRIEVRFLGKKIPIRHLSEYEQLKDKNLFDHLKTCYPSRNKFNAIKNTLKTKKVALFESFLNEVDREGLHSARRTFNRNRDFSRSIQPILDRCSIDLKLSKRWVRKIENRIVNKLDIKKYLKMKVKMEIENAKNTF